jgi:hypothetical protein
MKIQALILSLLALASAALAQTSNVPALISYSGKVVDASGNAITGQRLMTFRVWNHPTDSNASNRMWSEQQTVVLSAGEFSVLIGAGSAVAGETNTGVFPDAFNGNSRYLGVTVDDGTAAVDPEISPRQQIVTTAFAFRSRIAETVAPGGVTSSMLGSAAVNESALATAAVSAAKLADASVQTAKIVDGSVTTAKIADGSVTSAKLAGGQIGASVLTDGSLGTAKIADGAVNSAKIADGSVGLVDLAANSVDASKLTDGSVTLNKHADNSVNAAKIVDGTVGTAELADLAVITAKLADGAITTAKLGANSVTIQKMANDAVDRSKLHPTVRSALMRPPEVYDQLVAPQYATTSGNHSQFVPIDIENLGNDADGCRILIIGKHRGNGPTGGGNMWEWPDEWDTSEVRIFLAQRGMLQNGDFSGNGGQYTPGQAVWHNRNGIYHDYFWLGITDLSTHWTWAHIVGNGADSWFYLYTFYPGADSPGAPSPFNRHQPQNASNVDAGGPTVEMNVNTVSAESGVVTVVTRTGHAIQVGNTVTLTGLTGTPNINKAVVVTAVPSRNSFQFSEAGASGSFTGGWTPQLDSAGFERLPSGGYKVEPGYAKVTYKPTYSRWRLWLLAHIHTSARVIVYDN